MKSLILLSALFFAATTSGDPAGVSGPASEESVVRFEFRMFLPDPPGCDGYAAGDPDGNTTRWGGCNSNSCPEPSVHPCQPTEDTNGKRFCECLDMVGGLSDCYAKFTLNDDDKVIAIDCINNNCTWSCKKKMWAAGNFYPCECKKDA